MFIRLLITLALLLALPVHAARLALVMGNDNYTQVSKLQKAGNDATAMARELKAAGLSVITQFDGPLIEFGDGRRSHRRA